MPFPDIVPELADGVARLRAHAAGDIPRIVEQCTDPVSIRWTTVPVPYVEASAREWVEAIGREWESEKGNRYWAITAADDPDGRFLGAIDVRPKGAGIATIGYGLHPEGRGRHLMTSALRLATQWWFDQGGVRMVWEANRGNFASWRVAWACGFTFEVALPQMLDDRGHARDGWRGSIGLDGDLARPVAPWFDPPVLDGERVRLRPWADDDVAWVEPGDSPAHFMPPGSEPTRETFADWVLRRRERMSRGQALHWAMADADSNRALGDLMIGFHQQEKGSGELGYFLFPSARGGGRAGAATALAVEHAFTPARHGGLGLRRLLALTLADNDPSSRLLERLGFREWGREPRFCAREDGTYDDARHWVLLAPGTT
ncbi:MAG: GNAT family N-acetyltransferase [Tetrasphaera sp.]|nr:GNAT family N-acetyltransferase [Tetrasphaera sp.]